MMSVEGKTPETASKILPDSISSTKQATHTERTRDRSAAVGHQRINVWATKAPEKIINNFIYMLKMLTSKCYRFFLRLE